MEDLAKPKLSKIKIILYFSVSLVALVLILVAIKLVNAPIAKLNEWEIKMVNEHTAGATIVQIANNAVYDSLQRNIALRKALLTLIRKDSMVLVVNLPDSSLNLVLNGVFIHHVKIDEYEIDPMLKDLSLALYVNQFSTPLTITSTSATIVKEPIIEKEAPKSPADLLASLTTPDTLIFKPAYLKMTAENGINFFIEQTEDSLKEDRRVRASFNTIHTSERRRALFNAIINVEAYDYQPSLLLKVTKIELTAIYRALPKETKVVVYYR
jgi:hypothetical protein